MQSTNCDSIVKQVSIAGMQDLAQELVLLMHQRNIFAFSGPLGAGKTTLVANMLRICGVVEPIQSPTFTYVSKYKTSDGKIVYHFDLYRIPSLREFILVGFDEYLYEKNAWCFIEWPEVIDDILKNNICFVSLDYSNNQERTVTITLR